MALPDAEDLVYRGINTGNAESMAYRGWLVSGVVEIVTRSVRYFSVTITKAFRKDVER